MMLANLYVYMKLSCLITLYELFNDNCVYQFNIASFSLIKNSLYYLHMCTYVDISLSKVQTFIEECIITSKLNNPNVLSLIGVAINPEDATLHMIMSFMDHGDVKSFLKSKRGDVIEFDHFPKVVIYV